MQTNGLFSRTGAMPNDQLASLSQSSSAPGVTPSPCHMSAVSPGSGLHTEIDTALGVPATTDSDAPSTMARTNRTNFNMTTPLDQSSPQRPKTPARSRPTRALPVQMPGTQKTHLHAQANSLTAWSSGCL